MRQDGHGEKAMHSHQRSKTSSSTPMMTAPSSGQKHLFLSEAAGSGGGVQNVGQSPSGQSRKCVHTKDGVCSIHGEGAKKFPKLVTLMVRDKSGVMR